MFDIKFAILEILNNSSRHLNKFNMLGRPNSKGTLEHHLDTKFTDEERSLSGRAFHELINSGHIRPTYRDMVSPEDWLEITEKGRSALKIRSLNELDRELVERDKSLERSLMVVTLHNYEKLPRIGRYTVAAFDFTVVASSFKKKPEEKSKTQNCYIKVKVTDSLVNRWYIQDKDLLKILFEYGRRQMIQKIKDGSLSEEEEYWISSDLATCPFDPSKIELRSNTSFEVEIPEKPSMRNQEETELACSIISKRDEINALFRSKYGKKLLLLDQNRNLSDLFLPANSQEEFFYRVAVLGNLVGNLNVEILRKITKISGKNLQSINLLNEFLKKLTGKEEILIKIFRNIKYLRKGYPVHGDQLNGVIDAYSFFNLEYPLKDYKKTWKVLLKRYLQALEDLLKIIYNKLS